VAIVPIMIDEEHATGLASLLRRYPTHRTAGGLLRAPTEANRRLSPQIRDPGCVAHFDTGRDYEACDADGVRRLCRHPRCRIDPAVLVELDYVWPRPRCA